MMPCLPSAGRATGSVSRDLPALLLPALLLAAILSTGCGGGGSPGAAVIKIGEFSSLTGDKASFGQSTTKGIAMAVEEINAAGGVGGLPLRMITEDDQGKPEEAATAVNKLIVQDQVIAVLGEVASSNTLAAAPICQEHRVPMITPASTNASVTQVGDCIFRVCFIDPFQGTVMARFAHGSLNLEKVAVLRDAKSDYSVGLAQYFVAEFGRLGGTVTGNESFQQGDVDFKGPLTALINTGPQGLFVPGYYTEVGLIARQARELGFTGPLLGGDGWDSPRLAEIGGAAVEGCYFSNHYTTQDPSPVVQNFITRFRAKHAQDPDAMAALGYDAARLLAQCLSSLHQEDAALFAALRSDHKLAGAGREERSRAQEALRSRIAATRGFEGVTGIITLDEERNAHKPAVVLQVKNGRYEFVEKRGD